MIDYLTHTALTSWHEWMAEPAGRPADLRWVLASNGGTAQHDNVILFGFLPGQALPVLTAKVCRQPKYSWTLEAEYGHLTTLSEIFGEQANKHFPRALALLNDNDDIVLVTNYLPGRSLLFSSRAELWKDSEALKTRSIKAAKLLRILHEKTAGANHPAKEDDGGFARKATLFCERFDLTREERLEVDQLVELVASSSANARKNVLLQGDFWHGNMIERARTGALTLVDWGFARWSPDASQDVYLYLLAGAISAVPFAPADLRAEAAARQLDRWRGNLLPAYIEAYGHPTEYALLPPRAGMLACAIEMATRPALVFNTSHPYDDRLWRRLFAVLRRWDSQAPQENYPSM